MLGIICPPLVEIGLTVWAKTGPLATALKSDFTIAKHKNLKKLTVVNLYTILVQLTFFNQNVSLNKNKICR